ncbi:MAG TPA: polyprenyl synthetase family protein, partial [Kofleriaceae bacterium]|nr:polyprenyl synthetase family protein [Kofleriaceae bacterium]
MAKALASNEPRVNGLIESLGGFHGKMLRPSVVLLMAQAVGEVRREHHRLGAALEMIHTATLIHDDMIDEADTRRGKPTAHVAHGTSIAVLLGDYFYTHAFSLVSDLEQPWVMERLTRTTNVICRGELHQMIARRDVGLSEPEYDRIIYAKTAALTELAGELGALTASREIRSAAAAYGRCCGMAFQIVDDCLDFTGDAQKVGKTLATDIERGRLTLPILRLLAKTESGG